MSAESDRVTLVGPDIFTEGESYKMQGNTMKACIPDSAPYLSRSSSTVL